MSSGNVPVSVRGGPQNPSTGLLALRTEDVFRRDPNVNIFAGAVGGLCSLFVGHPLDTLKVRLQTLPLDSGQRPPKAMQYFRYTLFAQFTNTSGKNKLAFLVSGSKTL